MNTSDNFERWPPEWGMPEHRGTILPLDQSSEVTLSGDVLKSTFDLGLWYSINERADVLLDNYEEEDVPVEKLGIVTAEIQLFLAEHQDLGEEVTTTLERVLTLISAAQARDQAVRFAF